MGSKIKGVNKFWLLLIVLSLISSSQAQDCYKYYSDLKQDPKNTLALGEILKNCDNTTAIQHLILLKSAIATNFDSLAKISILELTALDVERSLLDSIIPKAKWSTFYADTYFAVDLMHQQEKELEFVDDTVAKLIQYAHILDQTIRQFQKLSESKGAIHTMDSIIMGQFFSLLQEGKLSVTRIGMKNEFDLYICLLHGFRQLDDEEFSIWNKPLLQLTKDGLFNPYYYANIIDERLRYLEKSEYPKYNFLRNLQVSPEKHIEINKNRREINAY